MLDYLLLVLIGCILGVVTGLTPGLHVNTVTLIGLSLYPLLGLSALQFSIAMVAMAIVHTFLDFIPSIFIGVPEESTALSVLPSHKLLIEGKAIEAVKLTAYGCLFGLIFSLIFLIPALYLIPLIYYGIRSFVIYIIILAIIFLILRERKIERIFWAVASFILSGILGLLALDLKIISSTQVLFPLFAGLFGLSNILFSIKSKSIPVPQEEFVKVDINKKLVFSGILGSLGGILVGVLPAMSPSQMGIIIYDIVGSDLRNFLISVSAINTSDAIYSLVALYTIHNPRSGVAAMIGKIIDIDFNVLMLFIGVIAFTAAFATYMQLKIGRIAMKLMGRFNYRNVCLASFFMVFLLIYIFTGIFGVFLAILSMAIGLIPILSGISRTHLMGVLILPTILYFLGF